EIVIAGLVEARHLGSLAADQRAPRLFASQRDPFHDQGAYLGRKLAAGKIVEEEERFGALYDEVIDRHRDTIDADRVVDVGFNRDLDLGADAIGGGDQHRIGEARTLEVEKSPEAA